MDYVEELKARTSSPMSATNQPLYDTLTLLLGKGASYRFFDKPLFQAGKTEADTNLHNTGVLNDASHKFLLAGFSFCCIPTTKRLHDRLMTCTSFQFILGCRILFTGTLDMLPLTFLDIASIGISQIEIPSLVKFYVDINVFPDSLREEKVRLKFLLNGVLFRPIQ
jgi:hypothetical protein